MPKSLNNYLLTTKMIKSEDLCLTFKAFHKLTLSTDLREPAL